jgi:hypothetical protein
VAQQDRADWADVRGTFDSVCIRRINRVGEYLDKTVILALSEVLRRDFDAVSSPDTTLVRYFDVHDPNGSLGGPGRPYQLTGQRSTP